MILRLSQGQLNLLEICPRKFQHIYLDQLGAPTTAEQQERLTWGSRFHLLMQQRELGLPITATDENNPLQRSMQALLQEAPDIFQQDPTTLRQSEYSRSMSWQEDYILTVVYDLLVLEEQQAAILDWKTYPQPKQRRWLEQNWQTRLYPFVLAETTDYQPEQISITYWFVQTQQGESSSPTPQHLKFQYSTALHQQTYQDLSNLLTSLNQWLQDYQIGKPFPQIELIKGHCQFCPFEMRCQRSQERETMQQQDLPTLADIQEVAI